MIICFGQCTECYRSIYWCISGLWVFLLFTQQWSEDSHESRKKLYWERTYQKEQPLMSKLKVHDLPVCSQVYINLGIRGLLHIRKTNMSGHNTPWHEFLPNDENWYVLNPQECLFRGITITTLLYLLFRPQNRWIQPAEILFSQIICELHRARSLTLHSSAVIRGFSSWQIRFYIVLLLQICKGELTSWD